MDQVTPTLAVLAALCNPSSEWVKGWAQVEVESPKAHSETYSSISGILPFYGVKKWNIIVHFVDGWDYFSSSYGAPTYRPDQKVLRGSCGELIG